MGNKTSQSISRKDARIKNSQISRFLSFIAKHSNKPSIALWRLYIFFRRTQSFVEYPFKNFHNFRFMFFYLIMLIFLVILIMIYFIKNESLNILFSFFYPLNILSFKFIIFVNLIMVPVLQSSILYFWYVCF